MGTRGKISAIWWDIKTNVQKLADLRCGYECQQNNLQNFTRKDLTEAKILQEFFWKGYFFETPCILFHLLITEEPENH